MKLELKKPHISIKSFQTVELPKLTILTGVNGAGKSHLLDAILKGYILCDIASSHGGEIKLDNWSTLVPNNSERVNIQSIHSVRDSILEQIRTIKIEFRDELIDKIYQDDLADIYFIDPWRITENTENPEHSFDKLSASQQAAALRIGAEFSSRLESRLRQKFHDNREMQSIIEEIKSQGVSLPHLNVSYFTSRPLTWNVNRDFQQAFGRLFLEYFEKQKNNRLKRLKQDDGETLSAPPLTDEQFVQTHGLPPWDFVNRTMQQANLDFQIDQPVDYEATYYEPALTKISTGERVDFQSLSSGEKILMSFAFCLYNSTDKRNVVNRPKLLLFDEIDAPLHPSMSRTLMNIIKGVLVEEHGIHVIFATHSPSTVAVAPDESIHVMDPLTKRIRRTEKRKAIATLTSEIPTLSINPDGRRQVFVESQDDADRYTSLYQILAPHISSERSLVFIPVGNRKLGGQDSGTGCDQVRKIVTRLADAGNISVFGLIDWDLKNNPTDRVFVLAHGDRYALENCVLDPILVGAAILRAKPQMGAEMGLSPNTRYTALGSIGLEELASISDFVQAAVLGARNEDDVVEVEYQGNFRASVDRHYLQMNGHELETKIFKNFPFLQKELGEQRFFTRVFINKILGDLPQFCPSVLVDTLTQICNHNG